MGIVSAMMQVGAAIKHAVAALFKVTHSLRFDGTGDYLLSAPISASDDTTFTVSAWVKMDDVTGGVNSILSGIYVTGTANHQIIFSTDGDEVRYFQFTNGSYTSDIKTSNSPISAGVWHHVVFQIDTTASLPDDRVKIWVDGTPQTNFATQTTYSQNAQTLMSNGTWPSTLVHQQLTVGGAYSTGNTTFYYKFGGLIAELHFIDGQALTASDFGETNASNQWVPKEVTGVTYGTNGFYLPFSTPSSDVNAFNSVIWAADGVDPIGIEGVGFQPDLVWMKARSAPYNHHLHDSVRGENKWLQSNLTNDEDTVVQNSLTSYDPDGFTLGTGSNGNYTNTGGTTHVAWCWKAGGKPTATNSGGQTPTSGSVMIDGVASTAQLPAASIYPTKMSVNTEAGFSIVNFTGNGTDGATVGHGLSQTPECVIVKNTDVFNNWIVYHAGMHANPEQKRIFLNLPDGITDSDTPWDDTPPTSSVLTLGTSGYTNGSAESMIAYCWHSVPGYSKIGSYTGSGGAGNKVTTGFKPAFVMIKSTGSNNWVMIDNKRSPTNPADEILYADEAWVEATGGTTTSVNFLADGFDFGGGGGSINGTNTNYIYMAFADTSPNLGLDTTTDGKGVTLLLDGSSTTDVTGLSTVTPSASGYSTNNNTSGYKFSQYIDMTGGFFNVSLPDAIGVSNEPFTVETWVYLGSANGPDGVFQLLQGSATITSNSNILPANSLAMGVYNGNWRAYDEAGVQDNLATAVTGSWNHVALTYDGSTLRWFLNGAVLLTRAVSAISGGLPAAGYKNLGVGVFYNSGEAMDGRLEGFRVTQGVARDVASGFSNGTPISGGGWDVALTNDDTWDKPKNNFEVNGGITPDDQLIDSPNLRFESLTTAASGVTLSDANYVATMPSGLQNTKTRTNNTLSGKVYLELVLHSSNNSCIGLTTTIADENYIGKLSASLSWFITPGSALQGWTNDFSAPSYNPTNTSGFYASGDILSLAIDTTATTIQFYRNGLAYGNSVDYSGWSTSSVYFALGNYVSGQTYPINFGQDHTFAGSKSPLISPFTDDDGNGEFYYEPPPGFKALATSY